MGVLDVTIINVALPQMRTALHMSASGQQWVINAYALTFAGFLMPPICADVGWSAIKLVAAPICAFCAAAEGR